MLIDGRSLPAGSVVETEIAIIGGGVAGITMALEFSRLNIPTCVLEAGGTSYSSRSQALYAGEVAEGLAYDLRATRSRYFGGSSNCWSGWCRPFGAMDLAQRDWVPESGWPIGLADLAPYYPRAREILQVADLPMDVEFWRNRLRGTGIRLLPFDDGVLNTVVNLFSPPVRLGRTRRAELEKSPGVRIILHSTATNLLTDSAAGQVTGIRARTTVGRELLVKAKCVVLAAGGIENARLLLLSNDVQKEGLGNANDIVGRYFMDHPRIRLGRLTLAEPHAHSRFYDVTYHYNNDDFAVNGTRAGATIGLSEALQRKERLMQCHTTLFGCYFGEDTEAVAHWKRVYASFTRHRYADLQDIARMVPGLPAATAAFLGRVTRLRELVRHYTLESIIEPVPDRDSRVTLSREKDVFGMRRVRLTWRVGELEKRTHRRAVHLLRQQIESRGLGQLVIDGDPWGDGWSEKVQTTWHQVGTTRMNPDPRLGVVDCDCKVHGIANLFIAGSSVFPTAGSNMPTLNLAALAARLADHIRRVHRDLPPYDLAGARYEAVA
jgi:choline dehydrogenase-like flavoprotein